jgi:hypothetical protein
MLHTYACTHGAANKMYEMYQNTNSSTLRLLIFLLLKARYSQAQQKGVDLLRNVDSPKPFLQRPEGLTRSRLE